MLIGSSNFYVDAYVRNSNVTGSSILLSIHFPNRKNVQFLVDCGMFQGEDNADLKNSFIPFDTKKIDFVLITHNHMDHIGLLELLVKQGYCNPIFSTYPTYKLIDIPLYDFNKISKKKLKNFECDESDAQNVLDLMVGCCYKRTIKPCKYVNLTFFTNGHLIGAAVIFVNISYPGEEDINLIFTGDYNNRNIFFNVEKLPVYIRNQVISAVFCESTYGNIDSTDKQFSKCLVDNIHHAIKEEKTIITPAFSQGRYQEMLYLTKSMQKSGLLPENIEIWCDGVSGQMYTKRYRYDDLGVKKQMYDFVPNNMHFVTRKDKNIIRQRLIEDPKPKIIISSGGMGSYGPVQKYISQYISKENALIHFLGYCSSNSVGYKLQHAKNGETVVYSNMLTDNVKKCDIKSTGELSSHAKRDELYDFLLDFPYAKSIILNHGEKEVKKSFAFYLKERLPDKQIAILNEDYSFKITSKGIVDSFLTTL